MTTNPTTAINHGFLVHRCIKLTGINRFNCRPIIRALEKKRGTAYAVVHEGTGNLTLTYDSSKLHINEIETLLHSYNSGFATGWWMRFKIGLYRYMDTNSSDNAKAEIHCCNKQPK